jgi:hypothetical protein
VVVTDRFETSIVKLLLAVRGVGVVESVTVNVKV